MPKPSARPNAGEQVIQAREPGGRFQVLEVDGRPARCENTSNITQLLLGDLTACTEPAQLLQDHILRAQHGQRAARGHLDRSPACELPL